MNKKPMNKKPINLTLHPRLVERARPVADSQGLSLSSWIGLLIYNALAEYHKASATQLNQRKDNNG